MSANTDQAEYWSSATSWVTYQAAMDVVLAPVLDGVLQRAGIAPGMDVIDIGCGTGASVQAAAEAVGPGGTVLGLDISSALLAHAQTRLFGFDNVTLTLGDAQSYRFAGSSCDAMISRFGVMFFADTGAAFANMATALRPGAAMTFAAWGPAPENPWFMLPAQVARARMGTPPKVDRTQPGPFALEDADRTTALLTRAGLDVQIDTAPVTLNGGATPEEAAELCTRIGPAASILRHFEGTEADRMAIVSDLAAEMAPWMDEQVNVPACIHFITVRAG